MSEPVKTDEAIEEIETPVDSGNVEEENDTPSEEEKSSQSPKENDGEDGEDLGEEQDNEEEDYSGPDDFSELSEDSDGNGYGVDGRFKSTEELAKAYASSGQEATKLKQERDYYKGLTDRLNDALEKDPNLQQQLKRVVQELDSEPEKSASPAQRPTVADPEIQHLVKQVNKNRVEEFYRKNPDLAKDETLRKKVAKTARALALVEGKTAKSALYDYLEAAAHVVRPVDTSKVRAKAIAESQNAQRAGASGGTSATKESGQTSKYSDSQHEIAKKMGVKLKE